MDWITQFSALDDLSPDLRAKLILQTQVVSVPKDTVIFGPGKKPDSMMFLISGSVRVSQLSETGREIVLYRINAGQSCFLTTASLLAYEEYTAEGVAETDIKAASIPRSVFDAMVSQSAEFRHFIFSTYSKRITDLFIVIEEIAFKRIDIRLAYKLLELSDENDLVAATHQVLATELGTAREVISRQLQEFQRRSWIKASRGIVTLIDPIALKKLSDSE